MFAEENKALVRRFYEEVFAKGSVAILDEFVTADTVDHNPLPGQAPGIEGVRQTFSIILTAFPDQDLVVEDPVAEGDTVVGR